MTAASLTSESGTVGSCKFFHSFLGMTFTGMSWVTMRLLLDTDTCRGTAGTGGRPERALFLPGTIALAVCAHGGGSPPS